MKKRLIGSVSKVFRNKKKKDPEKEKLKVEEKFMIFMRNIMIKKKMWIILI
ncbi:MULTISPECIES: hypothetical protein [unclassified Halanaerobium]|uniref:hypothetical protein n=1 Tax=unclassified Halanaerobium TaxID=2641197 RepID=UPI001314CAA1|nr:MULTISPECIES: hypothetical protein [unclassified Halanaerobium]